ncbi:MAG: arginine N-succinyltransferase [Deltaproteobacteria bacterium]|nr:MAG: arginine N-succinyltransferase [Deltaproteobacteria bacterium]
MQSDTQRQPRRFSLLQLLGVVLGAVVITAVATGFLLHSWLFARPFAPVKLKPAEESRLEMKLRQLNLPAVSTPGEGQPEERQSGRNTAGHTDQGYLKPEAYSEEGADRTIHFTERELNFLLYRNTDLAEKLVVDLADDLVSLKLRIPVDPDFPVLGGKTLKVRAGAELAYRQERPVVILKGVSIMGVPLPNAWLGNLKNIDLVQEFGGEDGFWKTFSQGVAAIEVKDGFLDIRLKE